MIAIDMDGVLANFTQSMVGVVNTIWPGKLPATFVPANWDWTPDLTPEEFAEAWRHAMGIDNFWMLLEPFQKNIDALNKFTRRHPTEDIQFLTSRPSPRFGYSAALQTESWLQKHIIETNYMSVQVVQHKEEKIKYLGEADHFIDDNGETIIQVQGVTQAYLLSAPYNKAYHDRISKDRVVTSLGYFLQQVERDL